MNQIQDLIDVANAALSPEGSHWLAEASERIASAFSNERFISDFSSAPRYVGKALLQTEEVETLAGILKSETLPAWTVDDVSRTVLMHTLVSNVSKDERQRTLAQCFRYSDNREHSALIKGLQFLPAQENYLPAAMEACRSNQQNVFESICCENGYPAKHFSS